MVGIQLEQAFLLGISDSAAVDSETLDYLLHESSLADAYREVPSRHRKIPHCPTISVQSGIFCGPPSLTHSIWYATMRQESFFGPRPAEI